MEQDLSRTAKGISAADEVPEIPDSSADREPSTAGAAGKAPEEAPGDTQATAAATAKQLRGKVARRRERLSGTAQALLAKRLRGRSKKASPAVAAIPRRPSQEPAPLSFAQERLWFLDRLAPGTAVYNMPFSLRLPSRVEPAVLAASLAEIRRRHEVLCATFRSVDGTPRMELAPPRVDPVPLVDLTGLPPSRRLDEAGSLADTEGRRSFDLTRGPVLRVLLLQLGDENLLIFNAHHIVFDAWSVDILSRELFTLYYAFLERRSDPGFGLEELPIGYADFAHWQRQWLRGEVVERQLRYWKQQLAGAPPVLELPTDRPRPAVQRFRGSWLPVAIPRDLSAALEALSRRQEATLFMTLLAAFKALLRRTTDQEDIVVGSPIAGRHRKEIEGLIGFFVNTLALYTQLGRNASFRELLARVRLVAMDGFAHQDLPFERLVEELQPERAAGSNPLFQVMFVLQNAPLGDLKMPGTVGMPSGGPLFLGPGTAKFDMTLIIEEGASGLGGGLEYNTDLFDRSTMARFLAHFERLLQAVVADPDERLSQLPWMTAAERHQLLVEWRASGTADQDPRGPSIHALVEAQADAMPDAAAVVCGRTVLSYRELDARAAGLAHHLRKLGVVREAETVVAIAAERAPEVVVGLLGILKAGGVYLPLDPSYPEERLALLLDDAGARVLLVQESIAGRLPGPEKHRAQVVYLDGPQSPAAERQPTRSPKSPIDPDQLAYLIYTSGTTGVPKGVAVSHRQVLPVLSWFVRYFALDDDTRVLQTLSPCFDFGVFELLTTLVAGGSLYFLPAAEQGELTRSLDAIEQHDLNTVHTTPAFFRELTALAASSGRRLTGVEIVHLGGEAVDRDLVREIEGIVDPRCRLYNGYGPTETSINSTVFRMQGRPLDRDVRATVVPIGQATASSSVHVLDRGGLAVPAAVPGELLIGGPGVARGYLNRPALTAERFVPDPFADHPGRRLYRSGDLVRWLPEGQIEFLGRIDHQVKIRGLRIELGEIEAALAAHPAVRQAVVLARERETTAEAGAGERWLVAYAVRREEAAEADAGALRAWLAESLPAYMVPSAVVWLDALPLTATGKVNRRALPAPEWTGPEDTFVAPRDPTEELLAGIWAEVLGAEGTASRRVGATDNFFELGGHSLLATQVVSRIRETFRVELPVQRLFEAPTVAELADVVRGLRCEERGPAAPAMVPVSRDQELPLSFAQQRLWFLDQFEPGSPAYNLPAAVRLGGAVVPALLEQIFNEVVRRHEALRTTFTVTAGRPHQVIAEQLDLPLPVVELGRLPAAARAAEARRLAEEEALCPFDLSAGPLIRCTLLRLQEEDHAVLVTMHHIVSDGWSVGVFLRELTALHEAFSRGRPSPLAELPLQYADFAYWQRQWLEGEVLEAELAFWKQVLGGAPQRLELPTDRPRPAIQTFRGRTRPVALSRDLVASLEALSRHQGATLYMTLLATFQLLLSRTTGQEDVAVGSPIAGRNRREIEGMIGFFVNTLVLRTRLRYDGNFREQVAEVRRVTLDAYAHQDLPFERLVEELQPQRDLSSTPLFQVMFILQNAPVAGVEMPGLAPDALAAGATTAKFDLTLSLREGEAGASGELEYGTDLFDLTTMVRLVAHFERLLAGIVADPERRLAELPWMTAPERHQLQVEWPGTGAEAPADLCIQELFEAQVEARPDARAVVCGPTIVSYRELDERASRLAHHLREFGVGRGAGPPEIVVGIAAERRPEVVVGLLGILKAGGVYLPLDPSHPEERLAFQLRDAGARVLLVCESAAERLPEHEARVVVLDGPQAAVAGKRVELVAGPDQLAYVIYTSGTTGVPKGVAVSHRQVLPVLGWFLRYFGLDGDTRVLQNLSPCFDFGVFELLTTLVAGGTLCFLPEAEQGDLSRHLEAIEEQALNTVHTTPSLFRELTALAARRGRRLPGLEIVHLGGEAISRDLVREIAGIVDERCRLYNGYGPTETSINSTIFRIEGRPPDRGVRATGAPIGRATAQNRVYVLDRRGDPVPSGVAGELVIGGSGVARGYLNRPALTAERFVPDRFAGLPDPFVGLTGRRLYRSGDLVRWLAEGEIEFLGRVDHQVKIRGLRIELGEIEAALAAHPAVRHAVVLARDRDAGRGERWLVAYAVLREGATADAGALRQGLGERLPAYMVPSAIVLLDALPRTATGKVDRRALPAPESVEAEAGFAAPGDPTEEILAGIWAAVLGRGRVGVHDNFFDVGGHSLLATQVLSRIRETFRVELPVQRLFEAPTVAELADIVRSLRRKDQDLAAPAMVPVSRDQELPLSFAQQRLWFLDQFEPGSPAYNLPAAVRLGGAVAPALLERIFNGVVRRHEALRTTFTATAGQPHQVIAAELDLPLPVVELARLPAAAREAEARRLAEAEALCPFDLTVGPLIRCTLLRLREEDHVVLVTMHHIVSDGWSVGIFLRELTLLHEAFSEGRPSPLTELPLQYADFAHWQRQWLQGEVLEAELAFWKQRLGDAPQRLELPTDRPRPAIQTFRGQTRPVALSRELSSSLEALSRRQGATLYMTLLATFQLLLSRTTGQEDIAVGSPIAGRNRREIEGMIGFFVNTLVLRTRLRYDGSFRELVAEVRRVSLDAYAHQDLPFERLVEELQPERDLSSTPLFRVMFILQNAPAAGGEMPGLSPDVLDAEATTAKFDLTLSLQEGEAGASGELEYGTDLFDPTTMVRLVAHFKRLLEGIVEDPERRLGELPWMTVPERHQLLVEWRGTGTEAPSDLCIRELFEAQVEARPDARAVVCGPTIVSYRELDERASRLAHHLRELGVAPEVVVGIAAERRPEVVVGLLGILKAGGVYLPLDPSHPEERLAFQLRDAGARVLLVCESAAERLPEHEARVVVLDGPRAAVGGKRTELVAGPDQLAYVIYTSGTTGVPKGVAVSHRQVLPVLGWFLRYFDLGGDTRVLQNLSPCFDFGVFELLTTLVAGGTLCFLPAAEQGDLSRHLEAIEEQDLNTVHTTPSFFRELTALAARRGRRLPGLEIVHLGGEAISRDLVREIAGIVDERCRLYNGYGPTETSINSTVFRIEGRPPDRGVRAAGAPIGRATAQSCAYVLDRRGDPVPSGVAGELVIGGTGVARGYLNRPAWTAERFVPDRFAGLPGPFAGLPGRRLYRSGDLVRWLAEGEIEFLGRIDHQVKIRGLRIELGEIEAALAAHPAVRHAVVLARERDAGRGERWLVAYAVLREGAAADAGALRQELGESLPAYMVPSALVLLDALPRTATGKVDRRALPAPESVEEEAGFAAPGDPTEEILAGIWAAVLGRGRVGVHDNFFEIGGHSLLATQVLSRIREAFRVEVPVQRLFEAPTVAGLAAAVRRLQLERYGPAAPAMVPVPRDRELPLSFAQQRLWFIEQFDTGHGAYNIPVAVGLTGAVEAALLERIFNEVVRRHEVLRTRFEAPAGRPRMVIADRLELSLPVVELGSLPAGEREVEVRRLAAAEAERPFDLTRGPLIRVLLVRLTAAEQLLFGNMHHIVSDGWSMEVLVRELTVLSQALSQGGPSPLPELPLQYADFAHWQRQWLAGEALETELAYWTEQLAGAPPQLELPTDRPRPAVQSFRGRHLAVALTETLSEALAALARREGATLFMTLLAAFKVLLHRYTGREDIVVGTPIAGRNRREIEGLIGFFVNTLVLRTDLSRGTANRGTANRGPMYRELLARVRRVSLDAYAHQDLPFERLVEELEPQRDLSSTPLFQVMFALQNAPRERFELPELTLSTLSAAGETAKFDLTLNLQEDAAGIRGELEYSTDLFDPTTMVRLVAHFERLLEGIVEDPERRLAELPRMTAPERHQLLVEWRETGTAPPPDLCIRELFEAQVEARPDARAVVCGPTMLSYRELDERASRLAHHLRELGVVPEVLVGIAAERRPEVVVGLLGILKAGGVYLPLDPSHPEERLAFQLRDAGARVLLVCESAAERLPEHEARVVTLDGPQAAVGGRRAELVAGPDQLAYVIYTSGTTGVPKGVAVSHRQVLPVLDWFLRYFALDGDTRVLQNLSPCFDFGVFELLTTLLAGGTLCFLPAAEQGDLSRHLEAIEEHDLNTVHTTPSFFRELTALAASSGRRLPGLEIVHLGGEAVDPDLVREIAGIVDQRCRLYNGYGPTETSINSTVFRIEGRPLDRGVRATGAPIGRATAQSCAYVLDRRGDPVSSGVAGELSIGGTGVARGYLSRPALTAERFVPDRFAGLPGRFAGLPGRRLYRSGDLVRWLADGTLEFLGRIDHQVKIRGLRIELGEIEAALARHPAVRHAVVLAREREEAGRGARWLVAYAVLREGAAADAGALRQELGESLPAYMVPSVLVLLDALPRTATGKVDRRALPAPAPVEAAEGLAAPGDPTEELLAGIWAAVLGRGRVGVHDNFFEIGGHSLLATQVLSRIRETFRVEVPVQRLFEAPTVAELAGVVHGLRQEGKGLAVPPMVPVSRDQELPLSFAQQRLWFLEQLEFGSPVYNIPLAVRLSGMVEAALLERVFNEVVRRHEVLRTSFAAAAGRPRQVIAAELQLPLPLVDLCPLEPAEREAEARRLAAAEARHLFDLTAAPLGRVTLLRLAAADHLLLVTMHHIVSDGWSMGVLQHELAALVEAFSQGKPSRLPELPIQYADFAHWQRHRLAGEVLEAELAYWRVKLGGAPQRLELPADHPRPAVQSFRGRSLPLVLPEPLSEALAALSRRQDATLFMTLLAAFQTLLSRYSGQQDIVVGSPIAGRTHREIEALIGFFVNTLVLRTDLSGNPSFEELLARVRHLALDAYAHQEVPFERLVEELEPDRDLGASPLFQVMFVLQNAPGTSLGRPGPDMAPLPVEGETTKFDLTLSLQEENPSFVPLRGNPGVHGSLAYSTDLLDPTTAQRLLVHFKRLLAGIVEDPRRRLGELPLLSAAESHALVREWNDTATGERFERPVHELVAMQVAERPEAVAVVCGGRVLSYGELGRRAAQLARQLGREAGPRMAGPPETVVALCMERSVELVVGMLGILAAGGAYLPLDPDYPPSRLSYMLADAGTRVILTQESLRDRLEDALPEPAPEVVVLDSGEGAGAYQGDFGNGNGNGNGNGATPENLAYLIYTSGSTGTPKGVELRHRGLSNLVAWYRRLCGITTGDRVSQVAGPSFDGSVKEFWPVLAAGGSLHIPGDQTRRSPAKLLGWLAAERIDLAYLPTPLAEAVLAEPWPSGLALRALLAGGDRLRRRPDEELPCALVNLYGPTENTVVTTAGRVRSDEPGLPAIGRPIDNTAIFVVDRDLRPVPVGVAGELIIRGTGLARGYARSPQLTAERFVADPFSEDPSGRLYRTGDLVRRRRDGRIEFLARIDHQVKIRGYRIELGEIEAVLAEHPAVRDAVVLAREDGPGLPGEKRLVAYLVCEAEMDLAELRELLRQRLPESMVPGAFVELESLPLLPNGKVDRTALGHRPLPEAGVGLEGAVAAPRDMLELRLIRIWEELLGIARVGIRTRFFDLGGHSLLAVRLMAQIRREFGRDLPLATLFQEGTIEHLGAILRREVAETHRRALVAIRSEGSGSPFFCVHPVGGNILCYGDLARRLGGDSPFYGLQVPDRKGEFFLTEIDEMAEHYVEAMREVQPEGPYRLGGWSMGGVVAFEMARRLAGENQRVERLVLIDSVAPATDRDRAREIDDVTLALLFARDQAGISDTRLPISQADLKAFATAEEVLTSLYEKMQAAHLVPPGLEFSEVSRLFEMFRINIRATERYGAPAYPGRLVLFKAGEPLSEEPQAPDLGWGGLAEGGVEVDEIPGDHYSILREPNVQVLADRLREILDSA